MTKRGVVPSLRRHKPTGLAVVTLNGKDHYLGRHGSPESEREYHILIGKWLEGGRNLAEPDLTVASLCAKYWRFAQDYYCKPDRTPTGHQNTIRLALRNLNKSHGPLLARDYGPARLKVVRARMIESGLTRSTINTRIGIVKRMFSWAVGEELLPPTVPQALRMVPDLRKGRSPAKEGKKVVPVSREDVEAVLPYVSPLVADMIETQWYSGMRAGELTQMKVGEIDRSGRVWVYTPASHKEEHMDKVREVCLGPEAQRHIVPHLKFNQDAYVFRPEEAETARQEIRRVQRKTKIQPSQVARNAQRKANPKRKYQEYYTVGNYRQAIHRGCDKAGIERWGTHQLRHAAATRIRKEHGIEAARAVLGHSSAVTSELYAELDRAKSAKIMGEMG